MCYTSLLYYSRLFPKILISDVLNYSRQKWVFDRDSTWIYYWTYTIIPAGGNDDKVNGLRHRAWRHRPYRGGGNSGYLAAYRRGRARGRRSRADRAHPRLFHRPFEPRKSAGKRTVFFHSELRFWKARVSSTGRRDFQEGYLLHSVGSSLARSISSLGLREDKDDWAEPSAATYPYPGIKSATRPDLMGEVAPPHLSRRPLKNLRLQSFGASYHCTRDLAIWPRETERRQLPCQSD